MSCMTTITPDWSTVTEFENKIAEFFGAPFAVATDSATHGIELCLRMVSAKYIDCPAHTYLSIPMLGYKLGLTFTMHDDKWTDYYCLSDKKFWPPIYDAAVLWRGGSYIPNSLMCLSFQYQKHLSLGRGGMILCPDQPTSDYLRQTSYDGRLPGIPWREQNIDTIGYHYYMTPETAALGLQKLPAAIATPPRIWTSSDYPDLTQMDVFKNNL